MSFVGVLISSLTLASSPAFTHQLAIEGGDGVATRLSLGSLSALMSDNFVLKSGDTVSGRFFVNRGGAALPNDSGNEVFGGVGASTGISRLVTYTFGSGSSAFSFWGARHARGTASAPTATQNNDILLIMGAAGYDGSSYGAAAQVRFTATEAWTSSAQGMKVGFYAVPNGAVNTGNPVLEGQGGVGISAFGQQVFDTNALLRTRAFTFATLPATGIVNGSTAIITDANTTTAGITVAGGGSHRVRVNYDGTNWKTG